MSFRLVDVKVKAVKTKREILNAKYELDKALASYSSELKEKVVENITHTYFNAMIEVDRRKLAEKAEVDRPRVDFYIKTIFIYLFRKLHRNDKLKAMDILEELKDEIVSMR